MTSHQHRTPRRLGLAGILGSALMAAPPSAVGQDVVLNPGFISGTVRVGNEVLTRADVSASGAGSSSSTNVTPPSADPTSASYTLTVNVPGGTSPTYSVSATARMDGSRDALQFAPESVVVDEGATSIVDFSVANPGFVQADVEVSGGTVSSLSLDIRRSSSTLPRSTTSGPATIPARVAVVPGTDLRVFTTVFLTNGVRIEPPLRSIDVAAGQTVVLDYDLTAPTPPSDTGTIAGTIAMPGPIEPQRHDVGASGPSSRSVVLLQDGAYTLDDLVVGDYFMGATTRFNNFQDTFTHPSASFQPSREVSVSTGTTSTVDIVAQQAFIEGNIDISGSASPADLNGGSIRAFGAGGDTTGASVTGRADPGGTYDLIVSDGGWSIDFLSLSFFRSDPDDYLNQSLFFRDFVLRQDEIAVAAGATASRDLELAMGEVTVALQIQGGTLLSNPSLSGSCQLRDSSNQLILQSSFGSSSSGQTNVEVGEVSFIAPEGTCTVTARATVGGSNVTFGQLTIDVEPGTDQVVDIGGPTLTVEFPEPNFITAADTITVTGRATDDVAVAGVTVNGVVASIASTSNANDPNEVSFSATIPLVRGPNEIVTVASDTADPANNSTNRRTVFRDEAPPTLAWTPDDGAVLPATGTLTSVAVSGTADDDAGIDSVLVEGASVAFTPTGNGNEVAFTTSIDRPAGTSFIEVVASDISDRSTTQTHEISITENRPPVADAGGPYTVDEGGSIALDASASSDPDSDPLSFAWDLDGDGEFDDATGAAPTFDASGLDGPDSVTASVEVSDGTETESASAAVTVENVAPTTTAGADQSVVEGEAVRLAASLTDPGTADTHTVVIDWGDGSANGSGLSDSHAYADDGVFTVTVTVTDDDGGHGSDSLQVTVENAAPVVVAGGDLTADEGGTVSVAGSFTDPGSEDTHSLQIHWGDGTVENGSFTASHVYADDGTYTVTMTVTDDDSGVGTDTLTVTVANVAPTVVAGSDQSADEGDAVSVAASFSDLGTADSHIVSIDWGDGSTPDTGNLNGTHVYIDDGTYTITVIVTDDDGGIGTDTLTVAVANVAPALGLITAPLDPVPVGQQVSVSASVDDPGAADTHSAVIDWGDGTSGAGTVASPASGSHVYDTPGVYTIAMIVTDDDGGSDDEIYQYVVVFDPSGAFVTGGGHIDSPAGAYVADPTLAGRATFGFVSKYKKGANTPSGNTEFKFKAGDLSFRSTAYDWLVVAGAQAKFKGVGAINGGGDYGFQLSARDSDINGGGTSDAFRIKIWDRSNGDDVVYDNEIGAGDDADPVTALSGGSIQIHEPKGGGRNG